MDNLNSIRKNENTRSYLQSPLPKRPIKKFKLDVNSEYDKKNIEQLNKREKFILSPAISPKQSPALISKNTHTSKNISEIVDIII